MAPVHSKRDDILHTACTLIKEQGVAQLTLDAVAKKAGVSKGGLLYHFPSKDELIKGIVEKFTREFDEQSLQAAEQEPTSTRNPRLKAFIQGTFEHSYDPSLYAGLMAAVATDKNLLEPVRTHMEAWQHALEEESRDPVMATILRLAADGLVLAELFELAPMEPQRRKQVLERMLQMIQDI